MSYTYNDIWVKGEVKEEGYRPSAQRYDEISKFCKQYTRPFSVLDLGAAEGYFTHRLAEEFEGSFAAVESDPKRNLREICESNGNSKVILMEAKLDLAALKTMAAVHHFDVILALNIVHHFDEPFQEVLDTLMSMCSYCFFEHPNEKEDTKTINSHRLEAEKLNLEKYNAKHLIDTDRWEDVNRKMYLLENNSPKVVYRHSLGKEIDYENEGAVINSSFDAINIEYKHRNENRPWNLGLNLRTFLEFNGQYPCLDKIFDLIDEAPLEESDTGRDLAAHNAIIGNNELILIDQNDPNYNPTEWFYITEKEAFKAGLLLGYSCGLKGKARDIFQTGLIALKETPNEKTHLAVLSTESGLQRCWVSREGLNKSLVIEELKI